jgi:hypothetical protein
MTSAIFDVTRRLYGSRVFITSAAPGTPVTGMSLASMCDSFLFSKSRSTRPTFCPETPVLATRVLSSQICHFSEWVWPQMISRI